MLGLGSYETAWTWLHKLRRAMVRPERERLTGEIEIDETYVGGPEEGKRGRETEKKALVVVATEKRGHAIGRIRLRRIKDVSAKSLRQFIRETIEPGATIHTDGWRGYAGLADAGYPHRVTVISAGPEQAHEVMPRVHKVAALLKRWLLGTLQGGIQYQHLDYYLDEFTFRFNRRRSQARGLLFHRLADSCFTASPNRLSPSGRHPTTSLFPAPGHYLDDGDTHFDDNGKSMEECMPIIKPISDLRNKTSHISDLVHKSHEPVFITKNGEGDMVLMSLAKYGEMERTLELYEKLAVAESQATAGNRGRPLDRVMADLRKRIRAIK